MKKPACYQHRATVNTFVGGIDMENLTAAGSPVQDVGIEFRTIDRFPGYKFGSDGSVWSSRSGKWRRLTNSILDCGRGQLRYRVHVSGRNRQAHRLIAEAFHGPCPDGLECCHNDGNGLNNVSTNLRWDTRKNNCHDRYAHGTANQGERHGIAKLTDVGVLEIRRRRATGESFSSIARAFHLGKTTVRRAAIGEGWTHVKEASAQ